MVIVLQLYIVLCLTNPLVQINHHCIICYPPITVSTTIFFVSALLDFSWLHKHQRYSFLDHTFLDFHSYQIFPESFPENLFCNRVGKFWIEVIAINYDLVSTIVFDEPSSFSCCGCGTFRYVVLLHNFFCCHVLRNKYFFTSDLLCCWFHACYLRFFWRGKRGFYWVRDDGVSIYLWWNNYSIILIVY